MPSALHETSVTTDEMFSVTLDNTLTDTTEITNRTHEALSSHTIPADETHSSTQHEAMAKTTLTIVTDSALSRKVDESFSNISNETARNTTDDALLHTDSMILLNVTDKTLLNTMDHKMSRTTDDTLSSWGKDKSYTTSDYLSSSSNEMLANSAYETLFNTKSDVPPDAKRNKFSNTIHGTSSKTTYDASLTGGRRLTDTMSTSATDDKLSYTIKETLFSSTTAVIANTTADTLHGTSSNSPVFLKVKSFDKRKSSTPANMFISHDDTLTTKPENWKLFTIDSITETSKSTLASNLQKQGTTSNTNMSNQTHGGFRNKVSNSKVLSNKTDTTTVTDPLVDLNREEQTEVRNRPDIVGTVEEKNKIPETGDL